MKASTKYNKISYKKMNVVAGLVRRKPVSEALAFLKFAPKKAARLLYKMVASAAANAAEQGLDQKNLQIDQIQVTKGALYKRWRPGSRGRAFPYRKHTSHCIVSLREVAAAPAKAKKVAKPAAKATTTKKPATKKPAAKKAAPKKAAAKPATKARTTTKRATTSSKSSKKS